MSYKPQLYYGVLVCSNKTFYFCIIIVSSASYFYLGLSSWDTKRMANSPIGTK